MVVEKITKKVAWEIGNGLGYPSKGMGGSGVKNPDWHRKSKEPGKVVPFPQKGEQEPEQRVAAENLDRLKERVKNTVMRKLQEKSASKSNKK
jgi:hypothetical protein